MTRLYKRIKIMLLQTMHNDSDSMFGIVEKMDTHRWMKPPKLVIIESRDRFSVDVSQIEGIAWLYMTSCIGFNN